MLLPKKHLTIRSAKSEEAILQTLRSMTEEVSSRRKIKDWTRLFYGILGTPEFVLHTVPEYRFQRNFILEIRGLLRREDETVVVDFVIRPHRLIRFFIPFYLVFCAFFLLSLLFLSVGEPLPYFVLFGMSVFAILLVHAIFHFVSKPVISALSETLS